MGRGRLTAWRNTMKITRRQLRRIIKEAFDPFDRQPRNLIKYRSVSEVMNAIADYYRKRYGPDDAKANTTIIGFLENDLEALNSMYTRDFAVDSYNRPGILWYSPSEISLSWGNIEEVQDAGQRYEKIPGDLAQIADKLYDEGRLLPAFLHLITGTRPRNFVEESDGFGSIGN